MAKQLQLRRGTTAQHSTFTGALGEVTVDTDKNVVVVHDGSTAGGKAMIKETDTAYTIATVNDFGTVPSGITTVIVKDKDRGGVFNRITSTFSGTGYSWERQYSGAVNVKWFGAVGDGITDDTNAIQKCLDTFSTINIPFGIFLVSGLRLKSNNQKIKGVSNLFSVLQVNSGVGIYNYTDNDSDSPVNGTNQFDWGIIEDLTIKGAQNPNANDWATVSGQSKTLSVPATNIGIKAKQWQGFTLRNVIISNFMEGIQSNAGIENTFDNCIFKNCEVGLQILNGTMYGNSAYKTTTFAIVNNSRFQDCFFGINAFELFQSKIDKTVVFEPCNTAAYFSNPRDNMFSGYYERCYAGIWLTGCSAGDNVINEPFFAGYQGNFWGEGYSITQDASISPNARTFITSVKELGGGVLKAGSTNQGVPVQILSGKLYLEQKLNFDLNQFMYVKNMTNRMCYPDPYFLKQGFNIYTNGAVTATRNTDNTISFASTGSGGISLACTQLNSANRSPNNPIRMRYEWKYTGTTPNSILVGAYFTTYASHLGAVINNNTGEWNVFEGSVQPDASWEHLFTQANSFNGTLTIRDFWVSEGFNEANSYAPNPKHGFEVDAAVPTYGSWNTADTVTNRLVASGTTRKYVCIAAGTPGTWQTF